LQLHWVSIDLYERVRIIQEYMLRMNKINLEFITTVCCAFFFLNSSEAVQTQSNSNTRIQDPVNKEKQISKDSENPDNSLHKVELRAAAFVPMSSRFSEIYGNVGPSIQLEATKKWQNYRNLELWGNVDWIFMDGNPQRSCGKTNVNIINLSVGLKAIGNVYHDFIFLYAGIGPDLGIVWLDNTMYCCTTNYCPVPNNEIKEHPCRFGVGGSIKTGSQIYFTDNFYLDVFADYLYLPVSFHHTVDAGGFKFGAGFGGRF
jgi:hypothetical protein